MVSRFIDLEDSIFAYKDSVYFNPVKLSISPTTSTSSTGEPPPANSTRLVYTVKSGDNLGFISMWYSVRLSDIKYWNNIRGNTIRVGQKLDIYVPTASSSKYSDINSISFAEKQARIGKSAVAAAPSPLPVVNADYNDNEYVLYTVRQGDTIWEIAKKYPGITETDILRINNISDASKIQVGQVLRIKPKS
jgi:membrane-bound lytic murein transglycosylase D